MGPTQTRPARLRFRGRPLIFRGARSRTPEIAAVIRGHDKANRPRGTDRNAWDTWHRTRTKIARRTIRPVSRASPAVRVQPHAACTCPSPASSPTSPARMPTPVSTRSAARACSCCRPLRLRRRIVRRRADVRPASSCPFRRPSSRRHMRIRMPSQCVHESSRAHAPRARGPRERGVRRAQVAYAWEAAAKSR